MFPRIEVIENNSKKEFKMQFYTSNQAIEIDKHLCTGCGICTKVCPKEAIITPPKEGRVRLSTPEIQPEISDSLKCSYCGTCAYMCPFNAIVIKKDGLPLEINDLQIVKKKVVPELSFTTIYCENLLKDFNIYMEGEIDVDWKKCTSCMNCVDV